MASGGSINGNVTISPSASGPIEFRNFGLLNGSITARNNPSLAILAFVSDDPNARISGFTREIVLYNLSALASFAYPLLTRTDGDLVFEDLPSLDTIDLSELAVASDVRLKNLPRLKTLLLSSDWFGVWHNIEVKDIGAQSIDHLVNIGFDAKTITNDGIPNVRDIKFSLAESQTASIRGTGEQEFIFDCSNCDGNSNPFCKILIDSLTVLGLKSVNRNHTVESSRDPFLVPDGDPFFLQVRDFTAINNTFTHLSLDFSNLTSLHIINNTDLRSLSYNRMFSDYPWRDIVITGNPSLVLNSSSDWKAMQWNDSFTPIWRWPNQDVMSMIFQGPFNNSFFQPFIDLGDGKGPRKRPRVLQKFAVESTIDDFNCTKLNSLRQSGVFKGEYWCQNQTLSAGNRRGKASSHLILALLVTVTIAGSFV